ncbi:hypothetical protein Oweho_3340 [Owenweeksia hongkongensis DSM 17368]|uniref:Uncharacterized protein n=2 Tax=Owenweeksia TaxID=267986 RepID=G8R4X7_OWEHD|nr:hypothetical protein Oweho_3340 [Owenweeksia hongkongensis DSM 17368]
MAAGAMVLPYVLPGGSLFAPTGSRKANHVVFCMFAGGVRNLESVHKNDGNLMPSMLNGNESISSDIVSSMSALPSPAVSSPLQNFGTLYKEFRYDQGPTGHFNGHTTAITGQYTNSSLSLLERPSYPTVFELYRKHNTPSMSALNSWWITHTNNLYPILNYSNYAGYGPTYGANQLSPNDLFSSRTVPNLINKNNFSGNNKELQDDIRKFMNNNFGGGLNASAGMKNDTEDAEKIENWIDKVLQDISSGSLNNPWNIPSYMNGDMYNIYFAEEVLKQFQPELLVVNMFGVDTCHTDFSGYCNAMRRADWAVGHLWDTIQNTPGLANDTVLIVAPEIGRNGTPNSIVDANGRPALDHTNSDPMSKEIFCLVAGPPSVVNQGKVISQEAGRSIDIVPTIANILGFDSEIPGLLPGNVLHDAFI